MLTGKRKSAIETLLNHRTIEKGTGTVAAHSPHSGRDSAWLRNGVAIADSLSTATERDEQTLAISELKNEISRLRRELRMLRLANAELERVAVRDTLTPLYNRRFFLKALSQRLVHARRYNTKAALLFIDVNQMKYINDAFGHSAGDYALVHTAHVVQKHIRATDLAARLGGDEFAIILEEVEEEQALAKAEQLADMLHRTPCRFGENLLPISAAIGLTMLRLQDTEETVIERADADMYARKRAWHEGVGQAQPDGPALPSSDGTAAA